MPSCKSIICTVALFASLGISAGSSVAQETGSLTSYPTVDALEMTVIPASDPVALAQRLRGAGTITPPPSSAPTRTIGEQEDFWVVDSSNDLEFQVTATLRAMGDHIYLWVENGTSLEDSALQALAHTFDNSIYEPVRELWGSEATPGVDGDIRLYGLFAHGLGSGISAYFLTRNTYPTQVYPTSNQHEMFFFNLDAISPTNINSANVASTVAHEFQHMIRANIQPNEALWLNEGFSTFTQLYLFHDPGAILSFMNAPGTQLNTWTEPRAPYYGAAMLFLAYFYERYGLDALHTLSVDPETGLDAFDNVLQEMGQPGVNDLFADWVIANYVLDPEIAEGRFGYELFSVDARLITPLATVTSYPYLANRSANQYSSDYYQFVPSGAKSLDIKLAVADSTQLIPIDAASGEWMWYSNRGDNSDMTLTHAFDLTGLEQANLSYRAWYDIEDGWDYAYIMVSTDDGITWEILPTGHTSTDDPHHTAFGPGYSGESETWVDEQVSLTEYAGQEILVRFEMITDDGVSQPGLAIDDVAIPEIGYSSDFEDDGGGWEGRGWIRTDNRLPQGVWVQAIQNIAGDVSVTRWFAPTEKQWSLPIFSGADEVILVISPFATTTTVPAPYTLSVSAT